MGHWWGWGRDIELSICQPGALKSYSFRENLSTDQAKGQGIVGLHSLGWDRNHPQA